MDVSGLEALLGNNEVSPKRMGSSVSILPRCLASERCPHTCARHAWDNADQKQKQGWGGVGWRGGSG